MKNVLVLCTGHSCHSTMAEAAQGTDPEIDKAFEEAFGIPASRIRKELP